MHTHVCTCTDVDKRQLLEIAKNHAIINQSYGQRKNVVADEGSAREMQCACFRRQEGKHGYLNQSLIDYLTHNYADPR